MAHKTEGDCPIATGIFIRKQADRQGVSIRAMIKQYADEVDMPEDTISRWVWPRNTSAVISDSTDKPPKKQTKPGVKKQLDVVVEAFRGNEITDDDAKKVIDIAADKVKNGTFSKRVGTKMATAIKKVNKGRKEVTVRETDNYQRLWKYIRDAANGLQILADGAMPHPENEEEAEALKGIMMALPYLCLQTARMGVDLMEIHESLNKGESINEKKVY